VEVLGEAAGFVGQGGQGGVVAHRARGRLAFGHLGQDQAALLRGVTENSAQPGGIEAVIGQRVERLLHVEGFGTYPLLVGSLGRQGLFDFLGELDRAVGAVEQQHLPRPELPGPFRPGLFLRAHSRFGGNQHHVGGDGPPGRPQAVAIHERDQADPIGRRHPGRTIPGLGEESVVLREGPPGWGKVGHVLPGRGHEQLFDVGQRATRSEQQFEEVVQTARVGSIGLEKRGQIRQALSPRGGGGHPFAGVSPRTVGGDRVDLAVVGQGPERLGDLPGGEGIGRIALVEDREGCLVVGVGQVPVEVGEIAGGQQTLVDDRAARGGDDRCPGLQAPLSHLAGQKQPALEVVFAHLVGGLDQHLLDSGQGLLGPPGKNRGMVGNRPETEITKSFTVDGLRYELAIGLCSLPVKEHPHDPQPAGLGHGQVAHR
jgi:hypothetical protein